MTVEVAQFDRADGSCQPEYPLIPILIISSWFIFPVLNNIQAERLVYELRNYDLPNKTEIIEIISGCGNTHKVSQNEKSTFAMHLVGKEFSSIQDITEFDGYYIVEWINDAVFSYFDIRGH